MGIIWIDNYCFLFLSGLSEFLVFVPPAKATEASTNQELSDTSPAPITWSTNQTKVLLDLYQKYRVRVGTAQIKNFKKLWEILAKELNGLLRTNVTAGHVENRWRVLERAYKRYVDNQNKTGQGKKYFEYLEEMDAIFKGKKNVNPVVLLSSESVQKMPDNQSEESLKFPETPRKATTLQVQEDRSKEKRTPLLNRNVTLVHMRRDKKEYYEARLLIEREKVDILKAKVKLMEEKNTLLGERNEILKKKKCVLCSQESI